MSWRQRKANMDYRILLECGCRVPAWMAPKSGGSDVRRRYVCTSGQGHGYQLRWVSWEGLGFSGVNPTVMSAEGS